MLTAGFSRIRRWLGYDHGPPRMSWTTSEAAPTMPNLSVVMPSFNQAQFLADAVHSVLGARDPGVELVVMDGGSDDGSQALLSQLCQHYPGQLRWWSGPDGGPAEAINEAVRRARAPVIGWLNSDDLYTPGAIERARSYLQSHPSQQMVYGHGEHVDVDGVFMERYPTLPASTPLGVFADGCFICQPTAFFRRQAFLDMGGLDTRLKAAFDFELWLRMFKAWPQGIGFLDAVQAQSRLHAGGITLRFRERVAMEGMEVIHRHLGAAPAHWLLTHVSELCAQQPFLPEPLDLRTRAQALVQRALPWLAVNEQPGLMAQLERDQRLQLSQASVHVGLDADGWAQTALEVRVFQSLRLRCRHHAPRAGLIAIRLSGPAGLDDQWQVDGNGEFELTWTLGDPRPGARLVFSLVTQGGFVPAEQEPGSTDRRTLAFRVEGCELF